MLPSGAYDRSSVTNGRSGYGSGRSFVCQRSTLVHSVILYYILTTFYILRIVLLLGSPLSHPRSMVLARSRSAGGTQAGTAFGQMLWRRGLRDLSFTHDLMLITPSESALARAQPAIYILYGLQRGSGLLGKNNRSEATLFGSERKKCSQHFWLQRATLPPRCSLRGYHGRIRAGWSKPSRQEL